jgi:hypothetical protein
MKMACVRAGQPFSSVYRMLTTKGTSHALASTAILYEFPPDYRRSQNASKAVNSDPPMQTRGRVRKRTPRKVWKRTLEPQEIQKDEKADGTTPKNPKTWNGGPYNEKKSKNDGKAF